MGNYVKNRMDTAFISKSTGQLNELIQAFMPDAVMIPTEKKRGIRVVGPNREGIVRLVAKIATQHEDCLGRKDAASHLNMGLEYDGALKSLRQAAIELMEIIDKTIWGNSADNMAMSDRFRQSLESQRGNNTTLDNSMKEIDDWYQRYNNHPSKHEATQQQVEDKETKK
jgi:hypothetical protein